MALPAILSGLGKNLVLSAAKGSKGSSSRSALVRRGDNVDDTKVVKKENYKKYFDSGEKKSSSIIVRPSSSLVSRKSVNIKSFGGDTGLVSIQNKIGNIENVLKESSLFKTKKSNEQKKLQEQNKRKKTEEKLETPEKKNGISLPIPGKGLFDNIMSRLSNFVFWVFIGKLLPAIIDFIPKIEGLLKVIGNIGDTILNIFGSILDSMVGFVSSAFKAWEDVKEIAKNIGGENAEKLLNDLSANFEKFLNLALIAGMLSTDIGDGGKPGKPGTPGKPGKPGRVGPTTSGGRPLGRPDLRNPLRQRPIITRGRGGSPRMPRLPGSGPRITGSGVNQSVTKGALSKVVKRIPIVGALIDFAINYFIFKEPLGRAAFKAVGSSLIGFLGGALGAVAGPPGAIAGGLLGGMAGDALGGMLYDKIFTGKNPPKKSIQTKSRGGQVSNSDRSAQPKRTFTGQRTRRPIIQRPKKSEPGKDVGGKEKIKILFPDTEYKSPMDFANGIDAAGDRLAGTWEMNKKLNRPNPYKALTSTAKILKDIPVIGGIMGASVDIALGQKVTPETLNSLFSSVDYLVKTSADKGVSNIRSIINGFDRGGNIPGRSLNVGDQNFNANKLSDVIKVSFNQKINQAIKEIQDNISRRPSTGRDEMLQDNQRRAGDGGGGPAVESINVSGFSAEDVDALGRMIAAEAAGESDLGKAGVLAVIMNRYRLIKSGKATPSQFNISGKTRDEVTIRDILFAGGTGPGNQFSPYKNGAFHRTSSSSGKSALSSAIRAGGNDPEKFKENLIKSGLSEQDADYVVRSVAFSNAESRGSRPFSTREVAVGRHSFQQSADVKLTGKIGKIDASVQESNYSGNLSRQFLENLNKPLPGITLSGQRYRASREGGKREHAGRDYDLSDDGTFYSRIGGEVIFAGDAGGGYGNVVDIYNKDLNRTERIAEGTTILPGIKVGSTVSPGQPVVKGTHQTGVIHYEIRKGKAGASGSVKGTEDPDEFLNSNNYKDYIKKIEKKRDISSEPVVRDLVSVQNKIRDMKPGDPPVTIPGVGKVVIKKNKHGIIIKEYYDSNNRPIDSGKFFDLVKGPSKPSTPTAAKPSTPLGPAPPAPVLPPPPSYAQPAARKTPRGRWGAANTKYGGGLIGSPNLNRSNVGSFASYEHPGVRTNIIFVPVPVNNGSMSPAINKSTGNVAPEKSSLNGMVGGMSKIHQLSRS